MAKQHYLSERFWVDEYIADLDPTEKLLFAYLLTNHFMTCYGIYDIPLRNIAFDTGIDKDAVIRILERFDRDSKISYFQGKTIIIHNYYKYQNYNLLDVRNFVIYSLTQLPKDLRDAYPDVLQKIKSRALASDCAVEPQPKPRRKAVTAQPDSTLLYSSKRNSTNLSSSSPSSPPRSDQAGDTPAPPEDDDEGKKKEAGGQAPQTPQDGKYEWADGVWLTSAQAEKYKNSYPDSDDQLCLITIAQEVSEYLAATETTAENALSLCFTFAQNKKKRRTA